VLLPTAPPLVCRARRGDRAGDPGIGARLDLATSRQSRENLLSEGQLAANPVAAMPSLHTAFATIIALFLAQQFRSAWRWLFLLYPLLMGLALVYLAEHYVVDVVAGVILRADYPFRPK